MKRSLFLAVVLAALPGIVRAQSADVASLVYQTPVTVSVGTSSGTLIAENTYTRALSLCTLPGSTSNVWINETGGTAVVDEGLMIPANHGCLYLGNSTLPFPGRDSGTGNRLITAITDGAASQTVTVDGM